MKPDPVLLEVPDAWDRVPADEFLPLRMVIRRPADQDGSVTIPFIDHDRRTPVTLNTDLFQDDVRLRPGESYALTLNVRFSSPGPTDLSEFYVQVQPEREGAAIVRLPSRPVRVVPSLPQQVHVSLSRICEYDRGTKLELLVKHVGATALEDFNMCVGPDHAVREGITCHRRQRFGPGQEERFELVIEGDVVEVGLNASADGQPVEDRRRLPMPRAGAGPAPFPPFAFLEPRALTTDRITVQPADGETAIQPVRGAIPVQGGGRRYVVTIYPSHPQARDVDLLGAPGQVEVEEMKSDGGAWSFLVTVVDRPWLTESVRLYYDVDTPDRVLRGELYFSIRPSSGKLWVIAATAGGAMTIQGFTGLLTAAVSPEKVWDGALDGLLELFRHQWADSLRLGSILLFRGALWAVDQLARPFREG